MKSKKIEKKLNLKKTKVLKFYQIETLFGGLANSGCDACTDPAPAKWENSPRRG